MEGSVATYSFTQGEERRTRAQAIAAMEIPAELENIMQDERDPPYSDEFACLYESAADFAIRGVSVIRIPSKAANPSACGHT